MQTRTKRQLLLALFLVLGGVILFGGLMTMLNWDFTKLSTSRYETNCYEIPEDYQSISVLTKNANVVLLPAEDGKCRIVCREQKTLRHSVEVRDGALTVEVTDTRKWYDYISLFSFESPCITLYLPQEAYGALTVKASTGNVNLPAAFQFDTMEITTSTGDVTAEASVTGALTVKVSTGNVAVRGVQAGSISLSASTGDITVSDTVCAGEVCLRVSTGDTVLSRLTCASLVSMGRTGDLTLRDTQVSGLCSIERSTGDVRFDKCDALELRVSTNTGDVTGSLLSQMLFDAQSRTGKVTVPSPSGSRPCLIRTGTGTIHLTVEE